MNKSSSPYHKGPFCRARQVEEKNKVSYDMEVIAYKSSAQKVETEDHKSEDILVFGVNSSIAWTI
jgi:ATP-dependent phosphoenolpyruvate carboxykinase